MKLKNLLFFRILALMFITTNTFAQWTVYDGSKLLTEYPGWTAETKGTAPTSGTCYEVVDDVELVGNKLIKAEDLTDTWKEQLNLDWSTLCSAGTGVTIVLRSKPTPGILALNSSTKLKKMLYISPRNGAYYDALNIEETAVNSAEFALKLNQTAGFSVPHTNNGWLIFRITLKNDALKVYINENPTPIFNAVVKVTTANVLQFGNNAQAPFGSFTDWMVINYNNAYAPGEGDPLPAELTGLPTGIHDIFMKKNLDLYPNPATNFVNIKANAGDKLTMYNQIGIMVARFTLNENIESLNVTDYINGMYLIQIESNDVVYQGKFIKN